MKSTPIETETWAAPGIAFRLSELSAVRGEALVEARLREALEHMLQDLDGLSCYTVLLDGDLWCWLTQSQLYLASCTSIYVPCYDVYDDLTYAQFTVAAVPGLQLDARLTKLEKCLDLGGDRCGLWTWTQFPLHEPTVVFNFGPVVAAQSHTGTPFAEV